MAKTTTVTIGDHVHYAPEGLEAPDASQTPTWIVVETNPTYTLLKQVGEPDLVSASVAPTKDLVPAHPDDLTELPTE
jgi:hypothetical protein